MPINNDIYEERGRTWWDEDGDSNLVSLRFLNNPAKFKYFHSIIDRRIKSRPHDRRLLDVGCGGGYLAEELARAGLDVTGIDPSNQSLKSALKHALQENLDIKYLQGIGENLPFEDGSFDFVCCCDVLEHVGDYGKILGEISRVLKSGGIFFYDTINRNPLSWLVMIKMLQDWKLTAFLAPNVHVWRMLIKPKELLAALSEHHLVSREMRGLSPGLNYPSHFFNLIKRARGTISWPALAQKLDFRITRDLSIVYLGYAIKN